MDTLASQHCQPDAILLADEELPALIAQLSDHWTVSNDGKEIHCQLRFKNYTQTLAAVNAIARISDQQDHHPDICFGYNQCQVTYSTHSAGGLTLNDFICAARIDLIETV